MAITRPTSEQLRFVSQYTGEHVLDTYLESSEKGGRSLTDLLDDLFDSSGVFRSANFEFRFDPSTDKIQFRSGNFANSSAGWVDVTTFFNIKGTFSSSTTYNNFDLITLSNKDVYIVHGLSAGATFADEAAVIASANTDKIVDVSEAKDWAIKTDGQVSSTDYSSKAWAIGGTGVTDTASKGAAKEWAIKTSGTVDGTNYSAKYWATSTDVTTVAGIAANITTVAGISSNVTAVAAKASLITSDFVSDLNTLAVTDVINDINLLATSDIVSDLNTIATSDIVSDLNTLATSDIVSDINTLATSDIVTDLNLLATSDFVADLNLMATSGNVSALNTVSGAIANVNTVAGVTSNLATVAGISANVTTVAGVSANVTTVAGIASDVTTAASNVTAFNNLYHGAHSSAPTADPDGSALDLGDLYFDSSTDVLKVRGSGGWVNAGSAVNGTSARFAYTASGGQTTFSGNDVNGNSLSFDSGFCDIYLNGVKLAAADFNASSGTSVVLTSGATAGDILEVVAFGTFTLSNQSFSGTTTVSNLAVTGTVDGRDVAADGTKLDGIEASATADQTKSDIEGLGIDVPAANLTGTIAAARLSTATTQAESDDSTKVATTAYVSTKLTTLIGGAPSTLNDLNELAAAINDDANYNSTLTTALGTKMPKSGGAFTGAVTTNSTFDGVDIAARDAVLTSTTTTANAALPKAGGDVTGLLKLSSIDPILRFNDTNGGTDTKNFEMRYVGTSSPDIDGLYFRTANDALNSYSDKMVILGSGNVGIGTVPESTIKVDVNSGTNVRPMRLRFINDNNGASTNPLHFEHKAGLEIENGYSGAAPSANGTKVAKLQLTTVTAGGYGATASLMGVAESNGYDAGALVFATGSNSSGLETERMRINSAGNVGIGITAPVLPSNWGRVLHLHSATANGSAIRLSDTSSGTGDNGLKIGNYGLNAYLNNSDAGFMRFDTNGAERLRIDSSGNVLVGTTDVGHANANNITIGGTSGHQGMTIRSPSADAGIIYFSDGTAGSGGAEYRGYLSYSHSDNVFSFGAYSATIIKLNGGNGALIKSGNSNTARILPETDNAGYIGESIHRWQALYAVNGTVQTSDQRQKTDIQNSSLGLDFIKALRPISYKWISGGKDITYADDDLKQENPIATDVAGSRNHYGLLAQEVKTVLGDTDFGGWVLDDINDEDSFQSLRYDQFVAPLIKAIQEQQTVIEALTARITALEAN